MSVAVIAAVACLLAVMPAVIFHRNLRAYQPPPWPRPRTETPEVSVLIPARNEAHSIRGAVESVLASRDVRVEVIVLDDHSQDATASIVRAIAERDSRVCVAQAPLLPARWCGKQHACAVLSQLAKKSLFLFLDADVRLAPHGIARIVEFLEQSGADLVSGFPRQETETILEQLEIPLIHFLLLGFLPFQRMRILRHPAYGAGCGQLFLARRAAYEAAGGHAAIRDSLHDGVKLPRSFRSAGFMTDICDATEIATCRMYRNAGEVWHGLAKNACEGLATPAMIVPATVLLAGGQILPVVLFALCLFGLLPATTCGFALIGTGASYYPRLVVAKRFRQPLLGALLHPLGMTILLIIQWYALARRLVGRPASWKGREYTVS